MVKRLKEFLDQHSIKYQIITHSVAYTSQEIAAMAHIPGQCMAKVVIIKADDKMFMAVLPASHVVDFRRIQEIYGSNHVELAIESQYSSLFEDCEPGAMPPFGNLYNLKVYVSTSLSEDEQIVFNAGSHRELIKLYYKDFDRLVKPQTAAFSIKDSQRT
ncbi:MAG TPA: YbaK/EbsC family protein [Chitinispirillaceae bacterium]|nr:YbaK/EbsC family protein [Chitinispirillaceae bacterium]